MCKCLTAIDRELEKHNTQLTVGFVFSKKGLQGKVDTYPLLAVELITKKRGAKPMRVIPTFCPWCGIRYEKDNEKDSK